MGNDVQKGKHNRGNFLYLLTMMIEIHKETEKIKARVEWKLKE